MGLAIAVLFLTRNLVAVLTTVVVVRIIVIGGILIFLKQQTTITSPINQQKIVDTFKSAYPFAIAGVLWILYYQVDVVMLKSLSTEQETGLYSASYRVLEMFSALPRVIFYVIFTRLAKYQVSDPEKLPEQLYKAVRLLMLLVIPSVVIAGFLQTYLMDFIYGPQFVLAVRSLSVLLPSLAVKVFGTLSQQFLQATGHESRVPKILTFTATANIAVNALLIPTFASLGAAIATLLSECVLAISGLRMLHRIGYTKASWTIITIAIASFVLATIPSLMLYGLSPWFSAISIVPCLAWIGYRLRLKHFQQPIMSTTA